MSAATPPARTPRDSGGNPTDPSSAGAIEGSAVDIIDVREGDERAYSFSFFILPAVYRSPGEDNLILQFRSEAGAPPSFGLQLWDDGGGQRGLWSSGDAMGGERFLAPLEEGVWHEAVVCFAASSDGDGFYLLTLDGQPIDARAWVSLIESGGSETQIETGLFRDGERVADTADVFFGPTRLGTTLESVIP